jgi:hypothetical protein
VRIRPRQEPPGGGGSKASDEANKPTKEAWLTVLAACCYGFAPRLGGASKSWLGILLVVLTERSLLGLNKKLPAGCNPMKHTKQPNKALFEKNKLAAGKYNSIMENLPFLNISATY